MEKQHLIPTNCRRPAVGPFPEGHRARLEFPVSPSRRQRGMTLLIGLILLLMLTVIGGIGYRNTTLSERMAGNSRDRNVSFQSAESAGKEALQVIESNGFSVATAGHYEPPIAEGGNTTFWAQGEGATVAASACATTTPFSWKSCAAAVPTKYANNASNAQYVIERMSVVSSGGSTVSTFRVTTRSKGGSDVAEVVLQTIYTRTTTP